MGDRLLQGYRVLVVEDEYMLAAEMRSELELAGAEVIGPIGHLAAASALANAESSIDAAVLDVNLAGTEVFPLADRLVRRGVPLVFSTGYEATSLPSRYAGCAVCVKPVALDAVIRAVHSVVVT